LNLISKKKKIECIKLRNQVLSKKLFTKERKDEAKIIFKKAKKAILKILNQRLTSLESMNLEESRSSLEKMIEKIKEVEIFFGRYGSDNRGNKITYNASAMKLVHESKRKWHDIYTKNYLRDTVYIQGMILNIDKNPDAIYRTILHELSHFVDPGNFKSHTKESKNPFQREIKCLRRDDSAQVKPGDANCFEKLASKYEKSNPEYATQARETASFIRENPDESWVSPSTPKGEKGCQMGQMTEAFSDWLSIDAYMESIDHSVLNLQAGVYRKGNQRIINIKERFSEIPKLLDMASTLCAFYQNEEISGENEDIDSHPLYKNRLNAILLAHPTTKSALGCSSKTTYFINDLESPKIKEGKVSCWDTLNYPKGKSK
jgi:hypothetical protein